ncbi:MAG TPA: efflux RND transporter periplasmic adaptor subunit [Edaphocola sp.]|nr:efflux RND transporter periplasmic adaptor subunit [Edaphocola sp.]
MKYAFLASVFSMAALAGGLFSCKNDKVDEGSDGGKINVITQVMITHPGIRSLADDNSFNAVSVFRNKSILKSSFSGYVQKIFVNAGDAVKKGQPLFILTTKEAKAIGRLNDSVLQFTGNIMIRSHEDGYVTRLNCQQGDYVMEGDQLCALADKQGFMFLLSVPFELCQSVKTGKSCDVLLPDGRHINGYISSELPSVDSVSQSKQYLVRIAGEWRLPEKLIVRISFITAIAYNAIVLPKSALLTDETENRWWVMKMLNDSIAVKIPVEKGMETDSLVQILSPVLSPHDNILISGNYGLPDTAMVHIIN